MSEKTQRNQSRDDADVARLLAIAGHRIRPPAEVESRVRTATMAAFDALPDPESGPVTQLHQHNQHRKATSATGRIGSRVAGFRFRFAVASAAALALAIVLINQLGGDKSVAGQIIYASGPYSIRSSDDRQDLSRSNAIISGAVLRTSSQGRLLIDLGDNRTLRVDSSTSLTLTGNSPIRLHTGRVYVDSEGRDAVRIATPFAVVTDIGTQFEVRVDGELLVVATREGQVNVHLGEQTVHSGASSGVGEELIIESQELVDQRPISTMGARWEWIHSAQPGFAVQNRSLREYLVWAARESGMELRFTSELAAQQAALTRLSGNGQVGFEQDSVARMLAATRFRMVRGAEHQLIVGLEDLTR